MEQKKQKTLEGFIQIITLAFQMNPHGKNRKYTLVEIISDLKESSEAIRQTYVRNV